MHKKSYFSLKRLFGSLGLLLIFLLFSIQYTRQEPSIITWSFVEQVTQQDQMSGVDTQNDTPHLSEENIESITMPKINLETRTEEGTLKGEQICGSQKEWAILLIGIDSDGYLYGLADVIRIIQVDMTVPQINVISIPRALLVEVPDNVLDVEGPMLINQTYFFGSPGMGHYLGEGQGAEALIDILYYSFGLNIDNYVVVNFTAFESFIDAIGGIEIDLPNYVDNRPASFFPEGKQLLNGEETLDLARVRRKYSDMVRIENQTLIMKAIIKKVLNPKILLDLPEIIKSLEDSVIINITLEQMQNSLCILNHIDSNSVVFYNPSEDILYLDLEYIPSLDKEMQIYRHDQLFKVWLIESLMGY